MIEGMSECRYHSHPIFAPKPSQKDNENQRNYQALFRCDQTRLEPFVGAIVGPYDLQLPNQVCHYCLCVPDPGHFSEVPRAWLAAAEACIHILA